MIHYIVWLNGIWVATRYTIGGAEMACRYFADRFGGQAWYTEWDDLRL